MKAYASVDLGGTTISCALANSDLEILETSQLPTHSQDGPEAVLARMGVAIEELLRAHDAELMGLGLGVPGLVDIQSGQTLFLPNLPTQWRKVAVAEVLKERLNCPVAVLNDARMATLGELTFGVGKSEESITMAFLTLGTGVGGGIAIDGKLRLGPLGAAGELGHQTALPDGPLCGCGNRGCLETLVSGPALIGKGAWLIRCGRAPHLNQQIQGDLNNLSPREMALAAENGDEAVREVIREAAGYLGIAVANIVSAIHPQFIVLGGGVANLGELLFETVRETIAQRVGMFPPSDVRVMPSALGDHAGLWGGLALARSPELCRSGLLDLGKES